MSSLIEAARSGDRLTTLRALRDVLAATITIASSGRDVAALSRQLTEVLAQIEALEKAPEVKGTPLDELEKRRSTRQPGASGTRRRRP